MRRVKDKLPSPAFVMAFAALVVAVAGNTGAFAGSKHELVRKRDLAKGAVTTRALAKGAVKKQSLGKGAVTAAALTAGSVGSTALAPNAVTANAIAPESVHGYALGPIVTYVTPIADLDSSADLSTWTTSNTESAVCGVGERLLTGGVVFTNPGNRRVAWTESLPIVNGMTNSFSGQITSDSGGTAQAQVQAICLR